MNKLTYKGNTGSAEFSRLAFPKYSDEHLKRLETENEPVAAILNALNEFEKKITPRPVFVTGNDKTVGECPNCGSFAIVTDGEHYCQECGQLLTDTTLKKSFCVEISGDCIIVTDGITGERKTVNISKAHDVSEMSRAAENVFENMIIDFLRAEEQFDKEKTLIAAANGSSEGGNK